MSGNFKLRACRVTLQQVPQPVKLRANPRFVDRLGGGARGCGPRELSAKREQSAFD